MNKYVYSISKDIFQYDNIDDAIDEAEVGEVITIYRGEYLSRSAGAYVKSAEYFLEDLREYAYDEVGAVSDSWLLNITHEHKIILSYFLCIAVNSWATATGNEPDFYSVENIEELTVKVLENGYELHRKLV